MFAATNTAIQLRSPRPLLGRMLGLYQLSVIGPIAIGSTIAGAVADGAGIAPTLAGCAVLLAALGRLEPAQPGPVDRRSGLGEPRDGVEHAVRHHARQPRRSDPRRAPRACGWRGPRARAPAPAPPCPRPAPCGPPSRAPAAPAGGRGRRRGSGSRPRVAAATAGPASRSRRRPAAPAARDSRPSGRAGAPERDDPGGRRAAAAASARSPPWLWPMSVSRAEVHPGQARERPHGGRARRRRAGRASSQLSAAPSESPVPRLS